MKPSLSGRWSLTLALIIIAPGYSAASDDFAIRDGDTVVFMGDSITAARTYGKMIENYTLLRFPKRKVRFINAGIGGDTAAGGLKRLERDVFRPGGTLLTVAFGINDIGWGVRADAEHKQLYLDSIREIVKRCRERGVRVYICSAAITAANPEKSENDFLQAMCDEALASTRELGGQTIDVMRTMREIQKRVWAANAKAPEGKEKLTLHARDGIHLNEMGHIAMAFAILKGLGAPADVSSAVIDAGTLRVIQTEGCTVSDVKRIDDGLEFTRLDEGLPLNWELFFGLNFRFIPIPDELNRYMLSVRNLPGGRYEITADGRGLGTFPVRLLESGVNLSSATADVWQPGGPWDAQARILKSLTEARHEINTGTRLADAYLKATEPPEQLNQEASIADAQLVGMQRAIATPMSYRFVVRRAKP